MHKQDLYFSIEVRRDMARERSSSICCMHIYVYVCMHACCQARHTVGALCVDLYI